MKDLIVGFPDQLLEALEIANNADLKPNQERIDNILITGLGGSGIGGKIVSDITRNECPVPVSLNNDYSIPAFVGKHTLVIVSSYSGNTEETLEAMNKSLAAGAEVACITSGGEVQRIAQEKGLNHIVVPGGNPPRACLGYSLVQEFRSLAHYNMHSIDFNASIQKAVALLKAEDESIKSTASDLASYFHNKTPIIYAGAQHEGVVVRLRQQLNENSKALCWHHVLPEMNHNELVGWGGGKDEYAVLLFRSGDDYNRTTVRMDISKEVMSKKAPFKEVTALGDDSIGRTLYMIYLGDWISWYLSELNGVDAIEIDVINHLKGELAKL